MGLLDFLPAWFRRAGHRELNQAEAAASLTVGVSLVNTDTAISERHESLEKSDRNDERPSRPGVATQYAKGEMLDGVVSSRQDYGIFVRLPNGEIGLVFKYEIAWPGEQESFKRGDPVKVLVMGFREGYGLSLSIKQTLKDESWQKFVESHAIGDSISGTVKTVKDFGIFVMVAPCVSGLLHQSELGALAQWRDLKYGDSISVKVLSIDLEQRRISLAMP
jgi:small subunit ribosomal protein S1